MAEHDYKMKIENIFFIISYNKMGIQYQSNGVDNIK